MRGRANLSATFLDREPIAPNLGGCARRAEDQRDILLVHFLPLEVRADYCREFRTRCDQNHARSRGIQPVEQPEPLRICGVWICARPFEKLAVDDVLRVDE